MINIFEVVDFFSKDLPDLDLTIEKGKFDNYVITISFKKEGITRYRLGKIVNKQMNDGVLMHELNRMLEQSIEELEQKK